MWHERAEYGHFFYRIPNGESAADAYDRVSGFNESLWRSFKEDDFASVCVLVTHGLMTRVFLMKWYHWSVEYFEDLRNMNHCEFVVMQRNDHNGKFVLRNQLRTWTEWRREQAEAQEEKRKMTAESPVPVRKKWGAVTDHDPSGFDPRKWGRQNTADLFRDHGNNDWKKLIDQLQLKEASQSNSNTHAPDIEVPEASTNQTNERSISPHTTTKPPSPTEPSSSIPSLQTQSLEILQSGRDGGGTLSGRGSRAGSEAEDPARAEFTSSKPEPLTDAERRKQFRPPSSMRKALASGLWSGGKEVGNGGAVADPLGDPSDEDDEGEGDEDEVAKCLRVEEQGFVGSVR